LPSGGIRVLPIKREAPRKRDTFRRDIGRVSDRSYASLLAFKLDVDPIAADTCVRVSVGQQNGMLWSWVEMFQHGVGTDSTCPSTGLYGHFQYLTERADDVSGYFSCLIPTCVRHHDDPQRVSPTHIAVGRKYAVDALGNCVRLVSRRYDNANSSGDLDHNLRIANCASIYYQK
jgi:hypothetical protein